MTAVRAAGGDGAFRAAPLYPLGGRPTVMTPERIGAARRMRADGRTLAEIAAALGVGTSTVRRALGRAAASGT